MDEAAQHVSKAQKRRQAREQEDADREQRIADELAQMGVSARVVEERHLEQLLQPLGLAVQDIPVSSPPHVRSPGCGCARLCSHPSSESLESWPGLAVMSCARRAEPVMQKHLTGSDPDASQAADGSVAVQADGHCLYRAVNEQLRVHSNGSGAADDYWAIRAKAAAYMRAHSDRFLPFMPEVHGCSSLLPLTLPDQIF